MPAHQGLADTLLLLCDTYCETLGCARATLSGRLFNDGRTLDRLATGGSMTIRNYEHAMAWLSANWPAGLLWPRGIDRPPAAAKADTGPRGNGAKRLRRVAA